MLRCAKAGVRTPGVYMVDQRRSRIYMEKLHGVTLKEFLRRHYDETTGAYDTTAVGMIVRTCSVVYHERMRGWVGGWVVCV